MGVNSSIACYVWGVNLDPDLQPRQQPARPGSRLVVNTRMKQSGVDWLDHVGHETRRTRSEVIRASIAVAAKHEDELRQMLGSA